MIAHVQRKGFRDVYEVYLYESNGISGSTRVYECRGADEWAFDDVAEGVAIERPTLVLSRPMLEAIVAASHDLLPPSAATQQHLADAIKVRDRLLTLVEREP